jgi:hypothetical protein
MGFHDLLFPSRTQNSTVCSTFSKIGWSVVRSASLAKGGTSKNRPSPHLHKVPTQINKVSPRNLQMVLVFSVCVCVCVCVCSNKCKNKWIAG